MTYNPKGLGISEMIFISVNYPDIWAEMDKAFDDGKDSEALDIARKTIALYNANLI